MRGHLGGHMRGHLGGAGVLSRARIPVIAAFRYSVRRLNLYDQIAEVT